MRARIAAVGVWYLVAGGCAPPPSAKDVARQTAAEVSSFSRGALSAASTVNGFSAVSMLSKGYWAATTGTAGATTTQVAPAANAYDTQIDQAGKFLSERVFTDANVESTDGNATVFRLRGDDLCTDGTVAPMPSCVDTVDRLEVRIKVASPANGAYDLTLLIGPGKAAPVVFRIRQDKSLALEDDLAQTKLALAHYASVTNTTMILPKTMEGVMQVMLERLGPNAYRLSESVLAAVHVEVDSHGDTYSFRTAVAEPLASLGIDADAKRLTLGYGLGETEYTWPYRTACSTTCSAAQRAPMTWHLGGASYAFEITAEQTELTITDIGLGDAESWMAYGGTRVMNGNLDPRRFALNIKSDTDGLPIFTLSSGAQATVRLLFSALAPTGDSFPSWALDERYTLAAEGAAPAFKFVERPAASTGALEVLSGSLSLSTDKPGVTPVFVSAGQCLVSGEPASGAHELLGRFTVVTCP